MVSKKAVDLFDLAAASVISKVRIMKVIDDKCVYLCTLKLVMEFVESR